MKTAGQSGTIALKSWQSFQVNDGLLQKVVEAVKAGEKQARTSGDVRSLEVFYHGFRQNIAIGKIYVLPAKIADKLEGFPTTLLYGCLVKQYGGEEMADLLSKKIGDNEFDEYSDASMEDIKEKLFRNAEGDFSSLILFAPAWWNKREYISFHFNSDDAILSDLVRHLVFGAYFDPRLSSGFNALMTDVSTDKLDVTDITPKLPFPSLSESPLKEFPVLLKVGANGAKRVNFNQKIADALTKQQLQPQESDVIEALDLAIGNVMGIKSPKDAAGVKAASDREYPEGGSGSSGYGSGHAKEDRDPRYGNDHDKVPQKKSGADCSCTTDKTCANCEKKSKETGREPWFIHGDPKKKSGSVEDGTVAPAAHSVGEGQTNVGPGKVPGAKVVDQKDFEKDAEKSHEVGHKPIGIELNADGTAKRKESSKKTAYVPEASPGARIQVSNKPQQWLWECELTGQMSDGMWENSSPFDHYKAMSVPAVIGEPGLVNVYPRRTYGYRKLVSVVGERMINLGKLAKAYPELEPDSQLGSAAEYIMEAKATGGSAGTSATDPSKAEVVLYSTKDGSDKEYRVSINPSGAGYTVDFKNGKRGKATAGGTKTPSPVSKQQAFQIAEALISQKIKEGYNPAQPQGQAGDKATALANIPEHAQKYVQKLEQATGEDAMTIRQKLEAASYTQGELMRDLRQIETIVNGGHRNLTSSLEELASEDTQNEESPDGQFEIQTSAHWAGQSLVRKDARSEHSRKIALKNEDKLAKLRPSWAQKAIGKSAQESTPTADSILDELLQDYGQAPLIDLPESESNPSTSQPGQTEKEEWQKPWETEESAEPKQETEEAAPESESTPEPEPQESQEYTTEEPQEQEER